MSTPDGLVKTVTSQVLDQIKADKQIQSGNITPHYAAGEREDPAVHGLHAHHASRHGTQLEYGYAGTAEADRRCSSSCC